MLEKNKFDFSLDPTYIEDGIKYIRYWWLKYSTGFMYGYCGLITLFGGSLYYLIHNDYITQSEIIDIIQFIKPYSINVIDTVQSESINELIYNTLYTFNIPIIFITLIYTKIYGSIWEYNTLKKKEKELQNNTNKDNNNNSNGIHGGLYKSNKINTLTKYKKNKISDMNLIYEIQLIKKRDKKRNKELQSINDIVDIKATFSISNLENSQLSGSSVITKNAINNVYKLRKLVKDYGINRGIAIWFGTGIMDPRVMGSTQRYGLLKLQTRLDEFGRVIPSWQRESQYRMILPCLFVFLFGPQIIDSVLLWGQ